MSARQPSQPRRVALIAPPRVTLQDLTGPYEVFSRAERQRRGSYEIAVAAFGPGLRVRTKFGLEIRADVPLRRLPLPLDTLLIAGSECAVDDPPDARFLRWLGSTARDARRVASVCVGSFHLAQAGLLDGRRATTHWAYLDRLRERHPQVLVDDKPIWTRDDGIYTSAGITAGIDLALALVEEDLGADVAYDIARELVVYFQRPADQPQLSGALTARPSRRDPLRELQAWVPEHLDRIRGVEDLATRAHMSLRNFSRAFRRETGQTPAAWLRALRLDDARRRLVQTDEPVTRVAGRAGFGSTRTLRRQINRSDGVPPTRHRGKTHEPTRVRPVVRTDARRRGRG